MANPYYVGGLTAVAQVTTFTPANVEINDIFTITLTAEDGSTTSAVSFTATAGTVANVTAGLAAAAAASTNLLFTAITWTSSSSLVTGTAKVAGAPFSAATSTTDGGGANTQTLVASTTTANVGPSVWSLAGNWSNATVPVNSDNVTIDGRAQADILYGLNQSAVTLASLIIDLSCDQNIGQATYALKIGATSCVIGKNLNGVSASGPGRINLDVGTAQTSTEVLTSSTSPTDTGQETVRIKGSHASNVLGVSGGLVGVGTNLPGDTSNFPVMNVSGGTLNTGSAVTAGVITNNGGTVNTQGAMTTINNVAGTTATTGTALITTVNAIGGTVYVGNRVSGSASVTTVNLLGGTVDYSIDPRPLTVTTLVQGNGTIKTLLLSQVTNTNTTPPSGNYSQVQLTLS